MPLLVEQITSPGLDYNNVVLLLIEVCKVVGIALGLALAYRANQNAKVAAIAASGAKASSENNAIQLTETRERVQEIKHQTDGITSKLVEAARSAARYEGKEEERIHSAEVAAHVAETALAAVAVAAAAVPPGAVLINNGQPVVTPTPDPPPGEK